MIFVRRPARVCKVCCGCTARVSNPSFVIQLFMFSIISTMLAGVVIGHFLHSGKLLGRIEKSTSLTIFVLLFVLGLSIGSNRVIVENLGRFGWQAAILATLSLSGSILAARIVFQLFFKKREEK